MGGRKLIGVLLALCLVLAAVIPAAAGDTQQTLQKVKRVKPWNYRYVFSTLGGAAIGAGIGALFGGNNITKGVLIGGGGMSALYLHDHRYDRLHGWRSWAYVGSYSAFSGGVGWGVCGCKDGLGAGLLIGGGAAALKAAWNPAHSSAVALKRPPGAEEQQSTAAPKRPARQPAPAQPAAPPPQF